jgi:hypothetical protein
MPISQFGVIDVRWDWSLGPLVEAPAEQAMSLRFHGPILHILRKSRMGGELWGVRLQAVQQERYDNTQHAAIEINQTNCDISATGQDAQDGMDPTEPSFSKVRHALLREPILHLLFPTTKPLAFDV